MTMAKKNVKILFYMGNMTKGNMAKGITVFCFQSTKVLLQLSSMLNSIKASNLLELEQHLNLARFLHYSAVDILIMEHQSLTQNLEDNVSWKFTNPKKKKMIWKLDALHIKERP